MKTTCAAQTPETPEFYLALIKAEIQTTFEHALDQLKKCEPGTGEAQFYMDILKAHETYHCGC